MTKEVKPDAKKKKKIPIFTGALYNDSGHYSKLCCKTNSKFLKFQSTDIFLMLH